MKCACSCYCVVVLVFLLYVFVFVVCVSVSLMGMMLNWCGLLLPLCVAQRLWRFLMHEAVVLEANMSTKVCVCFKTLVGHIASFFSLA